DKLSGGLLANTKVIEGRQDDAGKETEPPSRARFAVDHRFDDRERTLQLSLFLCIPCIPPLSLRQNVPRVSSHRRLKAPGILLAGHMSHGV
ncbi:MAG: hypothetical protein WB773_00725, partial [Isosphaeraceae bacterium]